MGVLVDDVRLYEFDKDEWWDVLCAAIGIRGGQPPSREEFERDWVEFQEIKRRKRMQ